jgi:hypothetical protein
MKNLSITALLIICCTQYIQSMELEKPSSNNDDKGYTIVIKDLSEFPESTPISNTFNALSEELYRDGITDKEIRDLVAKGAEVNYKKKKSNWPLVFEYANDNRVDNMRTVIELGAAIHYIQYQEHTPLTIALQNDHGSFTENKDLSDMIQLLITYENPVVTQYEHKSYDKNGKWEQTEFRGSEERKRECLISHCFYSPNITTIKMLIELKLMTANRGLKEFFYYQKPNQEVFNLLLAYGADNANNLLPKLKQNTFTSEQYIKFLRQTCENKAFDKEVLQEMLTIQEDINAIVSALQSNEPK